MRWLALFLAFQGILLGALSIPFDPQGENLYGHLRLELDRPIDTSTYLYVKFALNHFREKGAKFVILELNTPGGEVFAAQKISHLLHEMDALHHIPVIAYINHWALSAGAMLAYSCRYIAISPSASLGAAEPVLMKSEGMESAPEKINSALRAEFANLAALFGRDPFLAEAMVDKDIFLVRRDGKFLKLESEDLLQKTDEILSAKGKLLTLHAGQLSKFGLASFQTSVSEKGLFAIEEFKNIPNCLEIPFSDWKIDFFAFLCHPIVLSLLSLGIMGGIYLESSMPSHGVGIAISVACALLLFLSHSADAAIHSLEMIFFLLGVGLILLELFFVSALGLLFFAGSLLVIGSSFLLGLPDLGAVHFAFSMEDWNLAAFALYRSFGWFCVTFCLSAGFMVLLQRYRAVFFRRFILQEDPLFLEKTFQGPEIGALAETLTACRPFGKVKVGDDIFEASSEISCIDKGQRVKIVAVDGTLVLIRSMD
ncbi:MAG: hypothetical protein IT584_02800 [Chlamydiae bacterium]|nr:hypothetical protein [Chlamydiota bacterium]